MPIPAPDIAGPEVVERLTVRDDADLRTWQDRWGRLAHSLDALVFASPAWVGAWWSTFEPGAHLELLVTGDPAEPSGLLPLAGVRQRLHPRLPVAVPHRTIAGSGRGAADHLGPLARTREVADALLAAAAEGPGALVLANVTEGVGRSAAALPHATTVRTTPVPGIDLRGVTDPETLWNRKLVKNLRRAERRLAEAGHLRRWHRIDRAHEHLLDHHARLHGMRWRSVGRSGLFDPLRQRFLAEVGERLTDPDGVWLQLIEGPDGPIGSSVVLVHGRTVCTYSTGRSPAHHDLNLGPTLHAAAIRRAIDSGAVRYEFLRGLGPHKERLGGVVAEDATLIVGHGPAAALLRARERHVTRRDHRAPTTSTGTGQPLEAS